MSSSEFFERLKELVSANIAGNTQLAIRFADFIRKASRASGKDPFRERPDAETLLARWLEFNLASYSVVSSSSLALLNGLLSAAESTLIPTAARGPAPFPPSSPAPRAELRLSGRPGECATSSFLLENRFDQPHAITFECADLTPVTGPPLPGSLVTFEPAPLTIPPRGQAVVQAAVSITPDFVVGQTYTTTIRLLGFEAKELGLSITVLPSANPGAAS
jgi:hypothetical protein